MRRAIATLLLPLLLCAGTAVRLAAQNPTPEPATVRVELASGEVLIGVLESSDGLNLILIHPKFGRLVIPKSDLLHPDQLPPPAGPSNVVVVPLPPPPPPLPEWKGMAELGLTGSSGVTNESTWTAGFRAEHKTDELVKNVDFRFQRKDTTGGVTEEESSLTGRLTWPEPDSPWRTFVDGSIEKDQFQDWDYRLASHVGRGYAWYDTEETFLEGRFGLGVSKETGSDDDDINPEAVLGLGYRHAYSKVESVNADLEIFPAIAPFGEYRAVLQGAWEHKLSETSPWVFRIGGIEKYDHDPGDAKHNDFNYFMSLGYAF